MFFFVFSLGYPIYLPSNIPEKSPVTARTSHNLSRTSRKWRTFPGSKAVFYHMDVSESNRQIAHNNWLSFVWHLVDTSQWKATMGNKPSPTINNNSRASVNHSK
jgi:hypothetical protein